MTTLYQGFKNILKYILPMPARSQNREFNSIRANIQKQEKQLQQTVLQLKAEQAEILNDNKKEREAMTASLLEVLNKLQEGLDQEKEIIDGNKKHGEILINSLKEANEGISLVKEEISKANERISLVKEEISKTNEGISLVKEEIFKVNKELSLIKEQNYTLKKQFEALNKQLDTLAKNNVKISDEVKNICLSANKIREEAKSNYNSITANAKKLETKIQNLQTEQLKDYKNLTRKIDDQAICDPNWTGTSGCKRKPQIIVSMTTYPARIHSVKTAVKSIMTQSVKADRIILWLAKPDFPNGEAELPASLLELKEKGLEIRWCDIDYRSYKKLIPAFKEFSEDLIITADDDLIYPDTMIEQLYNSWEMHPECISALRVHLMAFGKDNSLAPYTEWAMENSSCIGEPRFDLFATTGAGAIFPPHILPEETVNWDTIKDLCPYADDVWIKMMSLINDVPIILTSKQNRLVYVEGTQEGSTLWKVNRMENDEQIEKVMEKYPILKEKVLKCAMDRYRGPLLTDSRFFTECLNLNYPGMEKVKELVMKGRFGEARKAFADHIRENLQPERYFSIPYEEPENIYKLPDETDIEACRRVQRHEMVSVGIPCDFGKDGIVDWYANPTDNNYREWTWQLNRHNELKMLAHEYRKTGEEWLAETAADLFTSWVKQAMYPKDCPGTETDCWRTIECGIRMGANWPYALFAFYKSSFFTDDILVDWYKSVWEHGSRLSKNHTSGNWLIMEMNGLAQIGILYPQFRNSAEWLKQSFESLEQEMDKQVYPDGFQYELSTNYHDVVVNNYQRILEVAYAFDISVPYGILDKFVNACEVYVKLMMPDGKLPDINDGKNLDVKEILEIRQRILARRGVSPDNWGGDNYKSVLLPYSGLFVMRTGWDSESAWALFDGGPFGKLHQHEDKLSVLFYAGGKLLLTEGGNYAYDDSEMRRYVLSSRAHNTVRVDGHDQNRRQKYKWQEDDIEKEADISAHAGKTWDYCEGRYKDGYGSNGKIQATHERKVFFCKKPAPYLIVVDRMKSSELHTYEWLWHIDSELKEIKDRFLEKVQFSEIDVLFSTGAASVICGQEEPEWQGFISTGLVQGMYRKIPCVSVKAEAKELRMVTALIPRTGNKNGILNIAAGTEVSEEEITLLFGDGEKICFTETELMEGK